MTTNFFSFEKFSTLIVVEIILRLEFKHFFEKELVFCHAWFVWKVLTGWFLAALASRSSVAESTYKLYVEDTIKASKQ